MDTLAVEQALQQNHTGQSALLANMKTYVFNNKKELL